MAAIAAEVEKASVSQKTRLFHIVVEGRHNPQYWMHIEVPAYDLMTDLDAFLRDIWLECCGHLSAFKVGTTNYSSEPEDFSFFEFEEEQNQNEDSGEDRDGKSEIEEQMDATGNEVELFLDDLPPTVVESLSPERLSEMRQFQSIDDLIGFLRKEIKDARMAGSSPYTEEQRKHFLQSLLFRSLVEALEDRDMEVPLEKALKVGQKFTYEYDFGSTTDLALRVVSEREGVVQDEEDEIAILARNSAPVIPCCVCGQPAKRVVSGYFDVEENAYCSKKCAKKNKESYEEMLPVVNSPRVGVCAYTGED
jgi:hypothetical protein